jgi:hypothetical protein
MKPPGRGSDLSTFQHSTTTAARGDPQQCQLDDFEVEIVSRRKPVNPERTSSFSRVFPTIALRIQRGFGQRGGDHYLGGIAIIVASVEFGRIR